MNERQNCACGKQTPNTQGNANFQPFLAHFKCWTFALGHNPPAEASVSFCFSTWLVDLIPSTAGLYRAIENIG